MIRVLQCVNDMHRAGLETMLMNYYRNIDRTKIQFDFLTHRPNPSDYDEEIRELGGRVFYAPRLYPQNYSAYFRYMKKFFEQYPEYKIMHAHIDSMSYMPLLAGKYSGVPVRIAHSHNTNFDKDFKYPLKQLFRSQIHHVANVRFACGKEAGNFLFGKRTFQVIPNAIDLSDFLYNDQARNRKRQELNLQEHFVVGHVGRFSYQKNHSFIIELFHEITLIRQNSILVLVGEGEKETDIKNKVTFYGLEDKVRFLGKREDVAEIYQAMDAFVLPSLFEGLPLVGIEAQVSGLPCFFSDKVPKEVEISTGIYGNAHFLNLADGPARWAKCVLQESDKTDRYKSIENNDYNVYDIRTSAKLLESKYDALARYVSQLR